jgi:integrase
MLRLGVGLPAFMQLLGHKDVRMTLRYYKLLSKTCNANFTAPA